MNAVGQKERATQNRVIKLFRDQFGYDYLGDWRDREDNSEDNSDVEKGLLSNWDAKQSRLLQSGSEN